MQSWKSKLSAAVVLVFFFLRCPFVPAQADEELTRERLTDRSGRVFSRQEILQMGLARFEKVWTGRWRDPISLYIDVAEEDNRKNLRNYPNTDRIKLTCLNKALKELDDSVYNVCHDMIGGGGGVDRDGLSLYAGREEYLRSLLLKYQSFKRPDLDARRRFTYQIEKFRREIRDSRRQFLQKSRKREITTPYPVLGARFLDSLDILESRIDSLDSLVQQYPDRVAGSIGSRLQRVFATLHEWLHM